MPGIAGNAHPRDLSEGQRLALALAVQLCPRPAVILLDEPTRGLDEGAKVRFSEVIADLAAEGRAVVIATHDVEFVARVADRVVVLAEGEIVADGPTADVVVASPVFAPQVAKVMHPGRWLTVVRGCCGAVRAARCSMRPVHAVRVRAHTWVVLAVGSLAGLIMFLWPLLTSPPPGTAHSAEAPFIFVLILPLVIAVVLAELSSGGLDVKAIAMLGLLSAVGAALRPLGAGTAGIETVFFLIILAGRVYGPGFGFVLGAITLFTSALLTGSVGPWLPFQMLASAWVGLGAGLLPRATAVAWRSRCSPCTARCRRMCSGSS